MLLIQNKQIETFKAAALKRFEDEMVDHVKEFFPNHFQTMQENRIRKTIQYGCIKAKKYGFTTIRNVCLYINNMLILGSNFDSDPQYLWAKDILDNKHQADPKYVIDKLSDKTLDTFDQICGTGHIYLNRALINLYNNADSIFRTLTRSGLKNLPENLEMLFPQKYKVVEEPNLNAMILKGISAAQKYEITSEQNMAVYIAFMFLGGSGFDADPQFSWAEEILGNDDIEDQKQKVELLFYKGMHYLGTFLLKDRN